MKIDHILTCMAPDDPLLLNIEKIIAREIDSCCWPLLAICLIINIATYMAKTAGTSYISPTQFAIITKKLILISFFLNYYVEILGLTDGIFSWMGQSGLSKMDVLKAYGKECVQLFKQKDLGSFGSYILRCNPIWFISLFTHMGLVMFMKNLRTMLLLVTSTLGPFAAVLSMVPAFSGSLARWLKSYIGISAWIITLNVFECIAQTSQGPFGAATGFGLILAVSIILTSTFTSMFIGNAFASGIISQVVSTAVTSVKAAISAGGAAFSAARKFSGYKAGTQNG